MEAILWQCILQWSVFFMPGIIMDAGANDGTTTMMLSRQFPNHTILSVEPILVNVANILKKTKQVENVIVQHGGLGERITYDSYPHHLDKKTSSLHIQIGNLPYYNHLKGGNVKFPIFTVDDLVNTRRLSFGHWDVEGSEIELLSGAHGVIHRDRPIFTVETFYKTNVTRHNMLVKKIKELNYTVIRINEKCGWPPDCRNLVCVPNELFKKNMCNHTTVL